MKHKISKVFFVIVMLLVLSLVAVACNDGQDGNTDPVKYAVTYVGGAGSTGTAPSGGEYAEGAKITLPGAGELVKANHTFGGWSYNGQNYAAGAEFTMPASAVEFTAVWNPNQGGSDEQPDTYAITYNINGATGTAPTETAKAQGAKFSVAAATGFSKANYAFGGWSYNGQTYAAGAEFTMPAGAVEFTAVWNVINYTVTFNPNNAEEPETWTVNVESGKKVAKPAQNPVHPDGKIFRYWKDESTGNEFNFDTEITEDTQITALFCWKLTFEANGGTGTVVPMWVEKWTKPVELPSGNSLSNPGKVFSGWTDGTAEYEAGDMYFGSANHTLRAVWKDATVTYTVTVVKDNSDKNTAEIAGEIPTIPNKAAGETFTIPSNTFTRPHYTFNKWRVLTYNTSLMAWEFVATYDANTPIVMPASNVRIEPTWTVSKVEISFNANGGTGTKASITKDYGLGMAFTTSAFDCTFTAPAGKEFAGWSNTSNGAVLANGTKLVEPLVSSDNKITLYAIWQNSEHPAFVNPVIAMEAKWSSASHELQLVADTAATETDTIMGYAVLDGVAYTVIISEGVLFANSMDYNTAYSIAVNNGTMTVTDIYNEDGESFDLSTKEALNKKQISDFTGKWIKGSQQWVITEEQAYYGLNLQSATVSVVGEYIVLYSEIEGCPYVHVMKHGDGNLTGYFCQSEKAPTAATFEPGAYLTLFVNGVLNQTVNSGAAPDSSKITEPTAPSGQVFSKWVLVGTDTEFVLTDVMTADASIEAKFVNQGSSTVKTYTGTRNADNGQTTQIEINLDTLEVTFTYTNIFGKNPTTMSTTATADNGSYKVSGSSNPTGSICWLVISADGNTLEMYDHSNVTNGPDELLGTYTLQA